MSVATTSTRDLLETPVLKSAISKASFRLMPMLVILYVVAFLDRTNVGFAEAALGVDKGITAGAYALGAGIFFIGYAIFEIPSNLLLTKFGAKIWLARIAITWGIVSACFAFVQGETSFIILRFLLGVTEAGLFPGVIMFLAALVPQQGPRQNVRHLLPGAALLADDGRAAVRLAHQHRRPGARRPGLAGHVLR